jgi:hypothetical protein
VKRRGHRQRMTTMATRDLKETVSKRCLASKSSRCLVGPAGQRRASSRQFLDKVCPAETITLPAVPSEGVAEHGHFSPSPRFAAILISRFSYAHNERQIECVNTTAALRGEGEDSARNWSRQQEVVGRKVGLVHVVDGEHRGHADSLRREGPDLGLHQFTCGRQSSFCNASAQNVRIIFLPNLTKTINSWPQSTNSKRGT